MILNLASWNATGIMKGIPYLIELLHEQSIGIISPDKARKGVIYPLKTGIYALVRISERTFTR